MFPEEEEGRAESIAAQWDQTQSILLQRPQDLTKEDMIFKKVMNATVPSGFNKSHSLEEPPVNGSLHSASWLS